MSVRRAQAEIDSAEFVEWCAFDRLDPYGPERADFHAGVIASTIAQAHGARRSKPVDFMPDFDGQWQPAGDELETAATAWLAQSGIEVIRDGN